MKRSDILTCPACGLEFSPAAAAGGIIPAHQRSPLATGVSKVRTCPAQLAAPQPRVAHVEDPRGYGSLDYCCRCGSEASRVIGTRDGWRGFCAEHAAEGEAAGGAT